LLHRSELETRLAEEARRLQESGQRQTLLLGTQHHAVVTRLKELETRLAEAAVARRLQESGQRQALRTQHRAVVTRLKELNRTQRRAEVTRLKELNPRHKKGFDTTASFPLQEKYQTLSPAIPAPPTTQIGPLCLSPVEAAALRAVQETATNNINPRVLYSDGSLLHSGTEEVSQAFGVVDLA